jgi:hypothetical protein
MPELPTLAVGALKQLKSIDKLYAKQTKNIVNQLQDNAKKQTSAIFSGSLVILAGILAVNSLWMASIISTIIAIFFWLRSK